MNKLADRIKDQLTSTMVFNKINNDMGWGGKKAVPCPIHGGKDNNLKWFEKGKMYLCKSHDCKYDIFDHYMRFYNISFIDACNRIIDDLGLNIEKYSNGHNKPTKSVQAFEGAYNNQPMGYLIQRGFDPEICLNYGVKSNGDDLIFEYRDEFGTLHANKYRVSQDVKNGKGRKQGFEGEKNRTDVLFNMDKVDPKGSLIIIEGEFKALALIHAGIYNVVSVPTGAESTGWIKANINWLNMFDEITLWFDNDISGKKAITKIVEEMNDHIINIVTCNDEDNRNDANDIWINGGKDGILKALENIDIPIINDTMSIESIKYGSLNGLPKVETGIRYVDANLKGGLNTGTVAVVTGENASGKTTLMGQLIANALYDGHKCGMYSGEMAKEKQQEWIYNTLADPEDLEIINCVTKRGVAFQEVKIKDQGIKDIEGFINGSLEIYSNEIDNTIENILGVFKKLVVRKKFNVFVIDNLMTLRTKDLFINELERQTHLITMIKNFAKKYGVVVYLVAHQKKGGENSKDGVSGSANITNLADYVFSMRRVTEEEKKDEFGGKDRETGERIIKKYGVKHDAEFKILKDRYNGSTYLQQLNFDKDNKYFLDGLAKKPKFYEKDVF